MWGKSFDIFDPLDRPHRRHLRWPSYLTHTYPLCIVPTCLKIASFAVLLRPYHPPKHGKSPKSPKTPGEALDGFAFNSRIETLKLTSHLNNLWMYHVRNVRHRSKVCALYRMASRYAHKCESKMWTEIHVLRTWFYKLRTVIIRRTQNTHHTRIWPHTTTSVYHCIALCMSYLLNQSMRY